MSHLLEFYGTECPHCEHMHELVEKLEKEEKVVVDKFECWHNPENEKKMEEIECFNDCGGVPFFYNTESKEWLCGEDTYENLKAWAKGEKIKHE